MECGGPPPLWPYTRRPLASWLHPEPADHAPSPKDEGRREREWSNERPATTGYWYFPCAIWNRFLLKTDGTLWLWPDHAMDPSLRLKPSKQPEWLGNVLAAPNP